MKEYIERTYRKWMRSEDLIYFQVSLKESDLYIAASMDLSETAMTSLKTHRNTIEDYILKDPHFKLSLEPFKLSRHMPSIVSEMVSAGNSAGVGPMASVAGIIAERVARDLSVYSEEVIVENGGDLYIISKKPRKIAIFAGESPFSGRLALEFTAQSFPLAIATSSGTVGPSLSFGKADAVVTISSSGAIADAAATAIGNRVKTSDDFDDAITFGQSISGINGIIIICNKKISLWGDVNICPVKM